VGVVTIPTMIRSGYSPRMAAALEAAASVGGQITPPIMGASAFIMADLLGVPYFEIAKAALLPAVLYFVSLFVTADLEAARHGLTGMRREDLPSVRKTLYDGWHFIVPVGVLIYFLAIAQVSPGRAAAWALVSFVPIWLGREIVAGRRIQLSRIVEAFDESSRSAIMIAIACAVVGIIMNVTDLTGLGLKFTSLIIGYSNDTLVALLLLTAMAAILLGTGLPTTATYLICAILVAPALAKMGVPLLTAHLFVFYFGVVSDLTPPTAVSCYVAAGIAGESGMRVSFSATRVALPALIVPFMFVYSPALMLNGSLLEVLEASVPALLGLLAMSIALIGYWMGPLRLWERGAALLAGVLMVFPGLLNAGVGVAVMAVVAFVHRRRRAQPAGNAHDEQRHPLRWSHASFRNVCAGACRPARRAGHRFGGRFDPEAAIARVAETRPALLTVYALRWTMQQGDKYAPYRERWGFSLSSHARAEVEAHLARGGGILALHTAIICFDDWAGWKDILAGRWEWGRSSHPPYGPVEVRPDAHEHPLLAGLPAFSLDDEAYGDLDLDPRAQPLMHVRASSGDWQPALWTHGSGKGRVVVDTLGHDAGAFAHPVHRRIVARAALWATGADDATVAVS
jgi:TRAP-type C4-dicarboxylate transport system permease large subunit/type 1 glutamine amidotransferase